jgi:hypothetical protein
MKHDSVRRRVRGQDIDLLTDQGSCRIDSHGITVSGVRVHVDVIDAVLPAMRTEIVAPPREPGFVAMRERA